MLVLTVEKDESVRIGDNLYVRRLRDGRLGFTAPTGVVILRETNDDRQHPRGTFPNRPVPPSVQQQRSDALAKTAGDIGREIGL